MKNSLIHTVTHAFVIQVGHRSNYSKLFGSRYRAEFDKQVDKLCLKLEKYGHVVSIDQGEWEFFLVITIITDKEFNSLLKLIEKDLLSCFPQLTDQPVSEIQKEVVVKKTTSNKKPIVIEEPVLIPPKKRGRPKKE